MGNRVLWDIKSRQRTCTLSGHENAVFGLAFNGDGTVLATGSQDDTVRFWDPRTCRMTELFAHYSDTVFTVAFSPDGASLVTGNRDSLIRVHRLDDPADPVVLSGHTAAVVNLEFADSHTLVSASRDGTARLWNTGDGGLHTVLRGHTAAVQYAALVRGNLLTAGLDGAVRAWNLDVNAVIARACSVLRPVNPARWKVLTPDPPALDACPD